MGRFSFENLPMSIILTTFAPVLKNGITAYTLFKFVCHSIKLVSRINAIYSYSRLTPWE